MPPLVGFSYLDLPKVNAGLNALAALLLALGYVLIKRRREVAHQRVMLTAFAVSAVFLVCYLTYHQLLYLNEGIRGRPFTGPEPMLTIYRALLISHVLLAVAVPIMAVRVIWLGYRNERARHIRLARWTFPIWMYVSITGVVIYYLLYHVYPPAIG